MTMLDNKDAARKHIEDLGYRVTPEAFVDYIHSFQRELIGHYLQAGISPNSREGKPPHRTPLMLVMAQNDPNSANLLIEAGADSALVDDHGLSTIKWAVIGAVLWSRSKEQIDICARLAEKSNISEEDRHLAEMLNVNMDQAFAHLLKYWCKAKQPERLRYMRPPASGSEIESIAEESKRIFPAALKALYELFDGEDTSNLKAWSILPLKEIRKIQNEMRKQPVVNDLSPSGKIKKLKWDDSWIPFAIDANGDLLFSSTKLLGDKLPGIAPKEPVYMYLHDEKRVSFASRSVSDGLRLAFENLPSLSQPNP